MCISCPRLVLAAAADWLLPAPRIPYGHMRTNESKENQQFKAQRTSANDRTSLVPYVSVLSAPSLQPTNNSPPSPQLCSYLFIPHWYTPLVPSKHQLPPVSILLRCPPSAPCVSLCQQRDPLALHPGGVPLGVSPLAGCLRPLLAEEHAAVWGLQPSVRIAWDHHRDGLTDKHLHKPCPLHRSD